MLTGNMCLLRSYRRRSAALVIVGSSLLGFGAQVWDVGEEMKGNQTTIVEPHRAIDDKVVEFKVLSSELVITERNRRLGVYVRYSLPRKQAVNHRPIP